MFNFHLLSALLVVVQFITDALNEHAQTPAGIAQLDAIELYVNRDINGDGSVGGSGSPSAANASRSQSAQAGAAGSAVTALDSGGTYVKPSGG